MTNARHLSGSPDWMTPLPIVEATRTLFGGTIDLDPCSDAEAQRRVRAGVFHDQEIDGLRCTWATGGRSSTVFINPPGSQVLAFWTKLLAEREAGHVSEALWVGFSLEQLQSLQKPTVSRSPLSYAMCIPSKRLHFDENTAMREARVARLLAAGEAPGASPSAQKVARAIRAGKVPPNHPAHANYISYIGSRTKRFHELFKVFGAVRQ